MTSTNAIGNANVIGRLDTMIGNIGSESIQFKFAQLQMKQAQSSKQLAEDYMKEIENIQKEQKAVADMVSRARELQTKAGTGTTTMPDDMVKFFKDRGLAEDQTGNDHLHNKSEWDFNIKSLTNYQEQVGTKTQTLMVYLQDFMGKYNSYLEGAKSSIDAAIGTTKNILQATR